MVKRLSATIFFLVLFATASPHGGAAAPPSTLSEPNGVALIELLQSGEYQALEEILTSYQDAFEAGTVPESWVNRAFLAFTNSDPGLEDSFERWQSAHPSSFAQQGAQGVYYWNLGSHARGGAFISKTHPDRVKRMQRYHNRARFHLTKAVKLRPGFSPAYGHLIDLAKMSGSKARENEVYQEGLAATPGSVAIRRRYIAAQLPWWGGSYARVDQLAAEARAAAEQWPAIAYLGAYDAYAQALRAKRGGDPESALPLIDEALETAPHPLYLWTKAKILTAKGRDDLARAYFDQALERWHRSTGLLDDRALLREREGDLDGALNDWEAALRVDPYEPDILRHRANVLWELKRHDEAKTHYDRAIVHGDLEARIQRGRGRFYFSVLKDYRGAADSFEAVTRLEPDKPRSWYDYSSALHRLLDCKIMPVLQRYLELCLDSWDCDGDRVYRSIEFMAVTWAKDQCTLDGKPGESPVE